MLGLQLYKQHFAVAAGEGGKDDDDEDEDDDGVLGAAKRQVSFNFTGCICGCVF
jgi:hypothetical protein